MIPYESMTEADNADSLGASRGFTRPVAVALKASVPAIVSHGRWVASCPHCLSGRWVSPDRPFWCPMCGNPQTDGLAIPVAFPADADDIDAVLSCRPDRTAMNWSPLVPVAGRGRVGETVEDLCHENLERGVAVPPGLAARAEAFVLADWEARGLTAEMSGWVA